MNTYTFTIIRHSNNEKEVKVVRAANRYGATLILRESIIGSFIILNTYEHIG